MDENYNKNVISNAGMTIAQGDNWESGWRGRSSETQGIKISVKNENMRCLDEFHGHVT